jgi:hypothetical protein
VLFSLVPFTYQPPVFIMDNFRTTNLGTRDSPRSLDTASDNASRNSIDSWMAPEENEDSGDQEGLEGGSTTAQLTEASRQEVIGGVSQVLPLTDSSLPGGGQDVTWTKE